MACRLAVAPTRRSPVLVIPTTEGVILLPSAFGMTVGSPASMTATTEFVVPKSMLTVLPTFLHLLMDWIPLSHWN